MGLRAIYRWVEGASGRGFPAYRELLHRVNQAGFSFAERADGLAQPMPMR
jgi:hypothetical protein